jgi:glutamate synthase domain-containing protein 1
MCGIVGFLDKNGQRRQQLGATLVGMLRALGSRGPDSAGVALYGRANADWILQIKLPERAETTPLIASVRAAVATCGPERAASRTGSYLRLVVDRTADPERLRRLVESVAGGVEVISLGHSLEILKQVGSPDALDATYGIARTTGTHGIGHTRLSTESKVDLSHSQPFWAHWVPDLASVHNGHITNYHKLRRRYEQAGVRFYTENDSEVIGVYLREQRGRGLSLGDAIRQSLDDLDGSFSYLVSAGDSLAYARDRFGFKPLVVAETDAFVAIATEEVALRRALGTDFTAHEPAPGSTQVWSVPNHRGHA